MSDDTLISESIMARNWYNGYLGFSQIRAEDTNDNMSGHCAAGVYGFPLDHCLLDFTAMRTVGGWAKFYVNFQSIIPKPNNH